MKRHKLIGLWLPAAVCMAAIFTLSSFPSLPEPPGFHGLDKPEHYIAYSCLSLLVFRAVRGIWYRWSLASVALVAVFVSAFYGITDEVHQIFVPPRCCEFLDWVADLLGSISGVIIALIIAIIIRRCVKQEVLWMSKNEKNEVVEEQEPVAEEPKPEEQPEPETEEQEVAGGDVYSLIQWVILMLTESAWQWMGLHKNPVTNKTEQDMAQVKMAIDSVVFLIDQVSPHVSEEQRRAYRSLISDLRINFVEKSQGG